MSALTPQAAAALEEAQAAGRRLHELTAIALAERLNHYRSVIHQVTEDILNRNTTPTQQHNETTLRFSPPLVPALLPPSVNRLRRYRPA